jgi:hypothetical protein
MSDKKKLESVYTSSDEVTVLTLLNELCKAIDSNTSAIESDISSETTARTTADNNLQTKITANTTAISNETTARTNADKALEDKISTISGAEQLAFSFTACGADSKSLHYQVDITLEIGSNNLSVDPSTITTLTKLLATHDIKGSGIVRCKGMIANGSDIKACLVAIDLTQIEAQSIVTFKYYDTNSFPYSIKDYTATGINTDAFTCIGYSYVK